MPVSPVNDEEPTLIDRESGGIPEHPMDLEPIMPLKSPCTMHLGLYRYRKLTTNFSEEAQLLASKIESGKSTSCNSLAIRLIYKSMLLL